MPRGPQKGKNDDEYTGSEPLFMDALQATSGLEVVLGAEPLPHQRRLLEALDVDWSVDPNAPRPCRCPPVKLRVVRRRPSAVDAARDGLAPEGFSHA